MAVSREFAEEKDIRTISDLRPYAKDLVFGAEHEFFDEEGTMRFKPLTNIMILNGRIASLLT